MPKSAPSTTSQKRVLLMIATDHMHERSILEGIADYAEHHAHWQHHLEFTVRPDPIERGRVDGMIVEAINEPTHVALATTQIPVITVANEPRPGGPPAVVVDNQAVGRMGANHLADLGLQHLAFVASANAPWSINRCAGFTAACHERKVQCTVMDPLAVVGEEAMAKWLTTLPDPVGVMASNDRRALEVSRACRSAGLLIPEQVALIGVDNEAETCRLAHPPLSSIDHGTRRIGYEAATLLDQWMTTGRRPPPVTLIQPVGVIARPSTDLLSIDNADVVAALRYIRTHADEPMKTKDVLKHVAMSRRSLELHFAKAIGRTIHEEIIRVRIDRAKQLLISSDWSIVHISDACGFAFPSQFSYAFRREVGLPPAKFREQYRYKRST